MTAPGKALVVGFGSIGQRHARLLGDLGLDVAVVSRRDVDHANVFGAVADAVQRWAPDYAVVASRTHEHRDDLAALAGAGFAGTVLVEKPLFDRPAALPDHGFAAVHVGYDMRFHPVVQRFRALLGGAQPHAVHAYVGHDLRRWWPDKDYRGNFRTKRDEGGGVLRDLSHEMDYLTWMLGPWTRLTAAGGQLSGLEMDSDDAFSLLFETPRAPVVTVNMNYLDSTLRRQVLALTDKGTILADLAAGTVASEAGTETLDVARDDSLIAQHEAALAGDAGTLCTVDEGLAVVRMIDAAERAAAERVWKAA